MKRTMTVLVCAVVAGVLSGCEQSASSAAGPDAERGKSLVNQVAMCQDCHSPRGPDGQFIAEQWLFGQTLPFAPTVPMPVWATVAPPIAGLHTLTDGQAMAVLTRGIGRTGERLRPPMPEYAMNERDARDVVAYLRSLAP